MADDNKAQAADKEAVEAAEREGEDTFTTTVLTVPPPVSRTRIYPATSINIKRQYWPSEHAEQTFLDTLYSRLQAKSLLFSGSTIEEK
jgi:hypothetical protein